MQKLYDIISNNEDWLIERVLNYAKQQDYVKYTSTLKEAWRQSISGLSYAIMGAITEINTIPEFGPDDTFDNDPICSFGIIEAEKHRNRGVTLAMFMGLMIYYKQSYLDLIEFGNFDVKTENYYKLFIERCFNRIEISFASKWASFTSEKLLDDLQNTNRFMTTEKNRYLTIFESLPNPVIIIDDNNNIININLSASQLINAGIVPGGTYYNEKKSNILIDLLKDELNEFKNISEDSFTHSFEKQLTIQDENFIFEIRFMKMLDVSQKFTGITIILNNITNLKKAEQTAKTANEAKSHFLSQMSHELRTPLNSILGYAQLMRQNPNISAEHRNFLGIIHKSGEHLLSVINEILDISKVSAKKIKLDNSNFNFHLLVENIQNMFQRQIHLKNLSFDISGLNDVPKYIFADEKKIRIIFINLIGNALKFTSEGHIKLRFSTKKQLPDTLNLIVEVEDTGVGINENEFDNLFMYFVQTESGKKSNSGTGIGLALCKDYINLMEGNISVTSTVNVGSTFHFNIKIKEGAQEENIKDNYIRHVTGLDPSTVSPKILITEDVKENRDLLCRLLSKNGFQVKEASNGKEAIIVYEQWHPDLIFMDIKMPVLNGTEATKIIKETFPDNTCKIIALSAHIFEDEINEILSIGCDDFISKPYSENQIFDIIAKHLKIKYTYNTVPNNTQDDQNPSDFDPKQASSLPDELKMKLKNAILSLDENEITEAIEKTREFDCKIGNHFMKKAKNLDYTEILMLLKDQK